MQRKNSVLQYLAGGHKRHAKSGVDCSFSCGSVFLFLFSVVFLVYVVFCFLVLGCQFQCSWLPGKTRLGNDLLCVEWDVKPYALTHSLDAQSVIASSKHHGHWRHSINCQRWIQCQLQPGVSRLSVRSSCSLNVSQQPATGLCQLGGFQEVGYRVQRSPGHLVTQTENPIYCVQWWQWSL